MSKKQDHLYRKKDVTGALAYVRSLFADLWEVMPEADRPKTDRDATALFFNADRSNASMADFQRYLQAWRVTELERLSKETRKPPQKRLVGFINMETGEKRPAFPDFLTLPADAYDELLYLVHWADNAPACIELPDQSWESINDTATSFVQLDAAQWPEVFVDSIQVETPETAQRNITPGTLVALLTHDDDEETEHHCVLVRDEK